MKLTNGIIVYQGPSVLTRTPIVAIMTIHSRNSKTGDMVQLWILDAELDPVTAARLNLDKSICGNCPHRPGAKNTCYVNLGQAPLAVWNAYRRGRYPVVEPDQVAPWLHGRQLRLGAYGDPAALPIDRVEHLVNLAAGHTGYSHQIRHPALDQATRERLARLVMISVDTPRQASKQRERGYRTFRVRIPGDTLAPGEIECLADSQGKTCSTCMECDGARRAGPDIAIDVHGARSKHFKSPTIIALG